MPKNSGYSAAELMAMQRDAAERVRQMQRRARERMGTLPLPSPPVMSENVPPPVLREETGKAFRQFVNDPDRLLLILLLFLLSQEETDPALLMALVFLML